MSYLVPLWIAIVSLFGGVIFYAYSFYKIYQNRDRFEIKRLFSNQKYFIISSFILLLLAGILFNVQFFINPGNVTTLGDALNLTPGDATLLYLGTIFLVISIFIFVSCFIIYYYLPKIDAKIRKKVRIIMFSSIIFIILSFVMATEGNADYLRYPLVNRIYIGSEGIKLVTVGTGNDWAPMPTKGWGFSIAFYALFIMTGAILVLVICDHQIYKKYGHHGLITGCFLVAFPSGIIGARLFYVIGEGMPFNEFFNFREGGLTILGGAATGIVIGVTFMIIMKFIDKRYKKLDYLVLADFIVPTILVAQAIGRIGNFFNNEVHGGIVTLDYYSWLPTFIKNNMYFSSAHKTLLSFGGNQIYCPFFLIEALLNLIGYFVVEYGIRNMFGFKKYHAEGSCVGWYLVWYGVVRIIMEPLRDPSYNMGANGKWSVYNSAIYIGVGALLVILAIIIKILRNKGIIKFAADKEESESININ